MRHQTRPADALDAITRDAMFALLDDHFVGVARDQFDADLADKTHAVLLFDDADELVGFSTFALYPGVGPCGEPATIVCSGDTIVAPRAWGSTHLPSAWIQAVHRLHAQTAHADLLWLLITSGYRTYRFLPVFVKDFVPAAEREPDKEFVACMHRLARARWGEHYDPSTGVVRFAKPQRLRPRLVGVPEARKRDRHVAYFLQRNPGHADGDELVSLARLDASNLTRAGLRMLNFKTQTHHDAEKHA